MPLELQHLGGARPGAPERPEGAGYATPPLPARSPWAAAVRGEAAPGGELSPLIPALLSPLEAVPGPTETLDVTATALGAPPSLLAQPDGGQASDEGCW